MTHTQLEVVCKALWGRSWQTDLAKAVGVNVRTVRAWVAGRSRIPENLRDYLAPLCHKHAERLTKLADRYTDRRAA